MSWGRHPWRLSPEARNCRRWSSKDVQRSVFAAENGLTRVDYTISNIGIDERGIPGVRIGTVEGLLIETDAYGRFHLEGIDVSHIGRGRNCIMKVDDSTLPPGSRFTTKNPEVKRITQGLPTRFDFGVQLPESLIQGAADVELELGEVLFAANSDEIRPEHSSAIATIAAQLNQHGGSGDSHACISFLGCFQRPAHRQPQ